jgi:hypothetical protein
MTQASTPRAQPGRQPEAIAAGLIGGDSALDLASSLTGFSPPTTQKRPLGSAAGLVSVPVAKKKDP